MRALLASASSIMFDSAFGAPAEALCSVASRVGRASCEVQECRMHCSVNKCEECFNCTGDSDDGFWSTSWGRLEKSTLGHVAEPTSFQQKRTLLSARELTEEDWA